MEESRQVVFDSRILFCRSFAFPHLHEGYLSLFFSHPQLSTRRETPLPDETLLPRISLPLLLDVLLDFWGGQIEKKRFCFITQHGADSAPSARFSERGLPSLTVLVEIDAFDSSQIDLGFKTYDES